MLWSQLDRVKTSDPALKESVKGLLTTWGRVVSVQEGVDMLWEIVCGEGGDWDINASGGIQRIDKSVLQTVYQTLNFADEGSFDVTSLA